MRTPQHRYRAAASRQRAIDYILKALSTGKSHMAAWSHHRADGKMVDADLYDLSPLQ